jgi:hypothetical protein
MNDAAILTPISLPTLLRYCPAPLAALTVSAIHDDLDSGDSGYPAREVLVKILISPLDHDQQSYRGE